MDGEFGLLAEHGAGEAVQGGDEHFSLRLRIVNVENLVFGDDERARLGPVILINLRQLLAHYQLPAAE